jgi:hypothetical protein
MRFSLVLATLALSAVAFVPILVGAPVAVAATQDGPYLIGYAANLNIGDSVVNLSNDGFNGGVFPNTLGVGNICVNTYVFDPQEEEIGCCACLVTPNGLNSLSVKSDLISNNLTPAVPTSVVIKLVANTPGVDPTGALTVCNPATVNSITTPIILTNTPTPTPIAPLAVTSGLLAWGTTLEPSSTPGTYNAVSVPFLNGTLTGVGPIILCRGPVCSVTVPGAGSLATPPAPGSELAGLTQLCNFIQANGTGFGICKSCRLGALGGAKQ